MSEIEASGEEGPSFPFGKDGDTADSEGLSLS